MKLFLFAIITFNFLTLSNATEPKEWFACKTNSDCVLTEDFCHWRAINKKFEKLFKEFHIVKKTKPILTSIMAIIFCAKVCPLKCSFNILGYFKERILVKASKKTYCVPCKALTSVTLPIFIA